MQPVSIQQSSLEAASSLEVVAPTSPKLHDSAALELAPFLLPTPDAIVICDTAGRMVAVNDQFCETLGYRESELRGQLLEMVLPTRFRAEHPAQRALYLADPMVRPMGRCSEVRALRADGREIPVEVRLRKVSDSGGNYVIASVRDVSEIRTLSEKLKSSNRILEQIASGQPLAKIVEEVVESIERTHPDLTCAISFLDRTTQKLYVLSAPRLPLRFVQAIAGMQIREGNGSCATAVLRNESVIVVDTSIDPSWAAWRELARQYHLPACWSEPIRDPSGQVAGTLAVYPNTSRTPTVREIEGMHLATHLAGIAMEREAHAEQLRDQEARLLQKQKLEAVGTLAGGVAHEFNNLLQIILGYTACALQGLEPNEQRQRDLNQVRLAAEHATSLSRQLLSYSRPQSSSRRPVDANALVTELQRTLAPLLGAEIDLIVQCDAQQSQVFADQEQLRQVLLNLCLNARDAMPTGGSIRIATQDTLIDDAAASRRDLKSPGRYVSVSVTDTGSGMPAAIRARVFEPFFTTKEPGKGTGLGLSVAYGIVRSHQGDIDVESELDRGTSFHVLLPGIEGPSAIEFPASPSAEVSRLRGGETILLAEDDARVRALVSRMLLAAGYTVLAAEDGERALEMFQTHREQIGLLILDLSMPRLNGRALAEQIWTQMPELPTIFLTGYDPDSLASQDLDKRGGAILTKPVEATLLLETVRTSLDARRVVL